MPDITSQTAEQLAEDSESVLLIEATYPAIAPTHLQPAEKDLPCLDRDLEEPARFANQATLVIYQPGICNLQRSDSGEIHQGLPKAHVTVKYEVCCFLRKIRPLLSFGDAYLIACP